MFSLSDAIRAQAKDAPEASPLLDIFQADSKKRKAGDAAVPSPAAPSKRVKAEPVIPEEELSDSDSDLEIDELDEKELARRLNMSSEAILEEDKRKKQKEKSKAEKEKSKPVLKKEDPEVLERTVHVSNVASNTSKKDLKKVFAQVTTDIESLRFRSIAFEKANTPRKYAFSKQEFHPRRESMNAYVVFKTKQAALGALKAHGTLLNGKHIQVDLCTGDKPNEKLCVFVGNLPFDAEEEDLRAHFQRCGDVDRVRVIRDRKVNIGKGFAYVTFVNQSSVRKAVDMHGSEFKNRELRVFKARKLEVETKEGLGRRLKTEGREIVKKVVDGRDVTEIVKKADKKAAKAEKLAGKTGAGARKAEPKWKGAEATKGQVPRFKKKKDLGRNKGK